MKLSLFCSCWREVGCFPFSQYLMIASPSSPLSAWSLGSTIFPRLPFRFWSFRSVVLGHGTWICSPPECPSFPAVLPSGPGWFSSASLPGSFWSHIPEWCSVSHSKALFSLLHSASTVFGRRIFPSWGSESISLAAMRFPWPISVILGALLLWCGTCWEFLCPSVKLPCGWNTFSFGSNV